MEKAASGSRPFFFLSLRSKPLEILLDLTAFCTCYTPLAANRGSRRIPMDYRRCALNRWRFFSI
jgi:hypothetical protein